MRLSYAAVFLLSASWVSGATLVGEPAFQIFQTSAAVAWTTNVPTDSWLRWGDLTLPKGEFYSPAQTTVHHAAITNLRPEQVVYVLPASKDSGYFIGASTASFTTPPVNVNGPWDFVVKVEAERRIYRGFSAYFVVEPYSISGSAPPPYTITNDPLPEGLALDYRSDLWGETPVVIKATASSSLPPGRYPVRFRVSLQGLTREAQITLVILPSPGGLDARPIASVPPIPSLAAWESHMTQYGRKHCVPGEMAIWEGFVWYYDGIRVYLQIQDYTNDVAWKACADMVTALYRDQYILPNNGGVPGYRVFPHGMWMDYHRTGNELSKKGVIALATSGWAPNYWLALGAASMREVSYRLQADLKALELGGDVRAERDLNLDILLGFMDQLFLSRSSPYHQPFMLGLVMAALIETYQTVQDPRIPVTVQMIADWLADNAYQPEAQSMPYLTLYPGSLAPDDNLLIASGYAWLWAVTGNPKYQRVGDGLFEGGVKGAWLDGGKQFSQNYRWSFDYVKWRKDPSSIGARPPAAVSTSPSLHVRVSPNPWRPDRGYSPKITFSGVSAGSEVKIFTVSGHLVRSLKSQGVSAEWNLANAEGTMVASGIYLYSVNAPDGQQVRGKLAVIR